MNVNSEILQLWDLWDELKKGKKNENTHTDIIIYINYDKRKTIDEDMGILIV